MIKQVDDIMEKRFEVVNAVTCVSSIKEIALEKEIIIFPVIQDNEIIGVITHKELLSAHPNRIAADAMTANFFSVPTEMDIWEARNIIKKKADLLLVKENDNLKGFITESVLEIEFGKYIDLLTGLYKSDYVYYHAQELINIQNAISFIFIDINNFGHIDKKYGHVFGDKILKEIAVLLDKNKPRGTYLSRFGGDEFLLLAPYRPEIAKKLAEDLLQIISAQPLHNIDISISAGISGEQVSDDALTNVYSKVLKLINTASLACSEAKNKTDKLCIRLGTDINEIA